jgi:hypothetical protein
MMRAQGKQISQGCLDVSTLTELRDDLLDNWETLYSHTNYCPCKKFTGSPIDRASNRQTYKKHFHEVPLLNNLVDTFEIMLPYLSVDLVWLLCKSKEGDGFQGWHKDFFGVDESPRLLLSILKVKRDRKKIHLYLLAMLLRTSRKK